MTVENFLIFTRLDELGINTRVVQVPAMVGGTPHPACSLTMIQNADRIIGVDPRGTMCFVYKDQGGTDNAILRRQMRRIMAHNRKKEQRRERDAWRLLNHVEMLGIVVATRDAQGKINILDHGNFRMISRNDGSVDFVGVASSDANAGEILEVKL